MKRTAKKMISRLLAFAMVLSILPAGALAAPMANTSVEAAVVAAVGGPSGGVFYINISGNPNVVGTLNLTELKSDYPNLMMVVADDTNITDVVPEAGVTVQALRTFASGTRQLAPAVNVIAHNAATANDIDLSDLVADLVLHGATDATVPGDLVESIASVKIAGTPVAFNSSNILSGTDVNGLAGLSAGSYSLAMELTFKHSTVTAVVNYTLNVLDTSLSITGPSAVYQGGTYVYTVVKTDENGAQAALTPADLTMTTNLSAAGSSATMAAVGVAVEITVVIDPSESASTYQLEVSEPSSGKTDAISFVVQALPGVGSLALQEVNNGVSAGDVTTTDMLHIKGGTSISSATATNVAPGGYSGSTIYLLKDILAGVTLDASYNSVFSLIDSSGNVQGTFINVNGDAAVRISALESGGTGTFDIVAPSLGVSETFNYAIQVGSPMAYALYRVDTDVYSSLSGLDVQQLVNDNDAAFDLVADYEYIGGGWNPVGVLDGVVETTVLEGKTAYFVVATRYSTNASDPWFMASLGDLTWNNADRVTGVGPIFGAAADGFVSCAEIGGQVVTYAPQNTPGLFVTSNLASGGNTVTAAANASISGGTPNPLYFDIRIIPRSIDRYEFRDESGTLLTTGINHIAIGSRQNYTLFAVYDNGDSVQVNFSSPDFASLTLNTLPANSIFSDVQLGNGVLIAVEATRNGGANDARVTNAGSITITDGSGKTGTLTLQLSSSLIERFTYYVETPGGIYDYNNPTDELKKIYNEAEVGSVLGGTVKIPRGLAANVWVVPVFSNDEMYDPAIDTAGNNSWQDFGVNITCSGGLAAPVYNSSTNAFSLRAYAELIAIGDSINVSFSASGTITSNGVGHALAGSSVMGTQLNVEIADAVLTNLDIMTYDAATNTYAAVPYSAGQYQLSGNVGDEIVLRVKATYSDGTAIDSLTGSAGIYAGGTFFLPMDKYDAYNPSAGNMTTPASGIPPLSDFASGTDAEMSVLYGHLMSKDPVAYMALVNTAATPSDADWLSPYSPGSSAQGILAALSNLIVPHITDASTAGGVTFAPAMKSGGVVPGHYELKLLQSGAYELDFSGAYKSNAYNAITATKDASNNPFSIQLTVSLSTIERTYLVSDDAIFAERDAGGRNIHRFDTTGLTVPYSFYVYPVILDSSYYTTGNTAPLNLVGTGDAGVTTGLNYMLVADWAANAFTFSQSGNILVTREDDLTNGYVRLKVQLLNSAIAAAAPETVDFALTTGLLQNTNPTHAYSAIGSLGQAADTFGVYTSSDPVVIDINIGVDYNLANVFGSNAIDLGDIIFYPIRYQFNDSLTRVLAPAERPGSAPGPNVLVVTPSASNPGTCGVFMNTSGALQFTPTTTGTYTFNISTTNTNGDGIPTLSQGNRTISFTVSAQSLTKSVFYGQSEDISSSLPGGAVNLIENGTSLLDVTALSNGRLEMLNNADASVTLDVLDASNTVIATVAVTLQRCDEVIEFVPASLSGYAFADGESMAVQWKTTYNIPAGGAVTKVVYTNLTSAEWAHVGGPVNFLALSGSAVTATAGASTLHAVYQATHTSGTSVTMLVSVDPALTIPTVPTYELRDSGNNVITGPISLAAGQSQNVFLYDTSTNAQVTSFLTNVSAPGVVSVINRSSLGVEVIGAAGGTATVTFSPLQGGSVSLTVHVTAAPIAGTYSVSGVVTDGTNPLSGATVTIGSQSTTTNGSGAYTISGISNGTYAASASRSDCITHNRNTTVSGSNITNFDFVLTPIGVPAAPAVTVALAPSSINVGATSTVTATALNFSGVLTYTWSISPAIATLSGTGASVTVTGVSAGTATITCSVSDGTSTASGSANITVTAVVTPPGGGGSGTPAPAGTFTVTYNANGGTGSKSIADLAKDSKHTVLTLANSGISNANHNFLGWNTQRNGNGTSYAPGAEITMAANVTLYAQWESQAQGSLELNTVDHFAYLKGNEKGLFMPDANMTRAEVAQMLYNLMVDTSVSSNSSTFTDVYSDAWYANAVIVLASRGVVKGHTDGTFRPDAPISRAEFVTMLSRFDSLSTGTMKFSDVPADHWAYDNIVSASAKGWTNGYVDGTFRPAQNITRSEAARMTNIMLGRSADRAYVDANPSVNRFSDVPASHWAYYEIIEATVEHEYTKDSAGAETWK